MNIRIYHECEGGIENPAPMTTVLRRICSHVEITTWSLFPSLSGINVLMPMFTKKIERASLHMGNARADPESFVRGVQL